MKVSLQRWLWLFFYFAILFAPLIVILTGSRPEPRELWRELSVGIGFVGLALVGVQFIPTARLQTFSRVFPLDRVYTYHRWSSIVGFGLILAHPLLLFIFNPDTLRLLNPFTAPARAVFGLVSIVALMSLILTSVYRQSLKLSYERWRILHTILAVVMLLTAMLHIFGVDYYLSMPWQRGLWIVLTVLWLGLILNTRVLKPLIQTQRPYRIVDIRPEAQDVWTVIIEPHNHAGIQFMPGQFAWLTFRHTPFAIREHPFSIASSAEQVGRLEFSIAEAGDFTSGIDDIPETAVVYVDGPHGTFSIDRHDGPGYVFIAGGIGSPPMLSILRTMKDRKNSKPAWMFYGNINPESIAYQDDLDELKQHLNLEVIHVLEEPPDNWQGETGFIDADILRRYLPENLDELIYFICGPLPMIDAMTDALDEIGIPKNQILMEQYDMV